MNPIKFIQPEKRRSPVVRHKIGSVRLFPYIFIAFFFSASLWDNGCQIGGWRSDMLPRIWWSIRMRSIVCMIKTYLVQRGRGLEHLCEYHIELNWGASIMFIDSTSFAQNIYE